MWGYITARSPLLNSLMIKLSVTIKFVSNRQYYAILRVFLNFGKIDHYMNRTIKAVAIITTIIDHELAIGCL